MTRGSVGCKIYVWLASDRLTNLGSTYYVIELVISMDNGISVARQVFAHVVHDLVVFRVSSTE